MMHKMLEIDKEVTNWDHACIVLTIGIPASGKSHWAQEVLKAGFSGVPINVVERDKLRLQVMDIGSIHDYKYTKARESAVTSAQEYQIKANAIDGEVTIVADTNLNAGTRGRLIDLAEELNIPIYYIVFDTPLNVCHKRNMKRDATVPTSVLIRMETKMRKFLGKYVYKTNPELPKTIVVDIDGTLADSRGLRGPHDEDKVNLDYPKRDIIELVNAMSQYGGYEIIVMSGRHDSCMEATETWLDFHGVEWDHLMMRDEGDDRKDYIVKEEMFDKWVKDEYDVRLVIDDREQVVMLWQSMGLAVADVGNGISDF